MSIEYGHIERVALQVPWSQLRHGGVSATISDVNIILRLQRNDAIPHMKDPNDISLADFNNDYNPMEIDDVIYISIYNHI